MSAIAEKTTLKTPTPTEPQRQTGMGAIYTPEATTFRVWAPNADAVGVMGNFCDWKEEGVALELESEDGYWAVAIPGVQPGDQYVFVIRNGEERLRRMDPCAREVRGEEGDAVGIVVDRDGFDWGDEEFQMPNWNALVIYELHVGSFNRPGDGQTGTFYSVREKLPYLRDMGVNCIKIMPPAEFPGDTSWGYNPNYPYAAESSYGGPEGLKSLIKAAHEAGIAVLIDVVYNHLGPMGMDLWRFDGWYENDGGGIYFYNDHRAKTPWGHTRPDYGRAEVRRYLIDNAMMWLDEYRADGIRVDSVSHIRSIDGSEGNPETELPDGWRFLQELNSTIHERFPWKLTVAEDLLCNEWVTLSVEEGGAGFNSQWDCKFVHPIRQTLTEVRDESRDLSEVEHAITFMYGQDAFNRIIYTESHDEVGEGSNRVPTEIDGADPLSYPAVKRSSIGILLAATAPGIPMLFQGQEFLETEEFSFPQAGVLDWSLAEKNEGIVRLVRDAFRLRRNLDGRSPALTGHDVEIMHRSEEANMLVFHRWVEGDGPGTHVVVAVNLSSEPRIGYRIPLPEKCDFQVLLNSAAHSYREDFSDIGPNGGVEAEEVEADGRPQSCLIDIGPYSVLILGNV